ncbi:Putative disease resistance protein [Arachis hypogaea]|nr:Putative disease resistance protein [Arachis hypogaea]
MKKVQKWREALTEAANLAGWVSSSCRDESELIQKIVKDVLQKLIDHNPPNDIKSFVGIDGNLKAIDSSLREVLEVQTRMIGIWDMGGIGKTTLAKLVFEKYSYQYEGSCFLENVRERSEKYGHALHELRNELYSELLQENNCKDSTRISTNAKERLRSQRNFIVLDDVSCSKQLKYLVGEHQCYGPGSKIIVTATDKSVFAQWEDEEIYEMKVLNSKDSLTLFSLNAFNQDHPKMGYEKLSWEAVKYCEGLPLALKVLGSFLRSKSETEWDSALQNIKKIPDAPIQNVLRLTYDALNYEEREIFLDIACFFKGFLKEHVVSLLESCGFDAANGMRSLHEKSLIAISDNSLRMHDLIHEMALEIVRKESIKNPEYRSRLWDYNDIRDVLGNNKGTDAIESIMLDMSHIDDLQLSVDTFKKMSRLRLLKLYDSSEKNGKLSNLQLPIGLKPLRYFEWHAYPLPTLPSNFCPEKLVTLRIQNSQLKRLWDGKQNLVDLEEVDLTGCQKLVELPDLSKAKNLKSVHLSNCRSLAHVHPSILSLGKLELLDLLNCIKLEMLGNKKHSRSLKHLCVCGCSNLIEFALSSEEIEYLDLSHTGIKVLHPSIGRFTKVKEISLCGIRLKNLPDGWSRLKSLEKLSLFKFYLNSLEMSAAYHRYKVTVGWKPCGDFAWEHQASSKSENTLINRLVPEWFTYRAVGSSITFEVAPPSSYYFGSLLCIVLSSHSLDFELDIKCRCYLEDGKMHKYSLGILFLSHVPVEGHSDHVYMTYNFNGIFDVIKLDQLNNKIASSGHKPKLTFEFFVSSGMARGKKDLNLLIKECGVYPLNDSNNCVE